MKVCRKCKRSLHLDAFCKSKNRPDGLNLQCRECVSARRYPGKAAPLTMTTERIAYYRALLADPTYLDRVLDDSGMDALAAGLSQIR